MARRFTPLAGETAHVTIRCNNKEFLFHLKENFNEMVSWLNWLPIFFKVEVHHVLFMSNHIHFLTTPREDNFGQAMSYFLTNLSKFLNYSCGRRNHIFGGRYYPTIINDERHLMNVIRYIYQNPLRAGIVTSLRDYSYSSLNFYLRAESRGILIYPDRYTRQMMDYGLEGLRKWAEHVGSVLNNADLNILKKSFKRRVFKLTNKQYRLAREGKLTIAA